MRGLIVGLLTSIVMILTGCSSIVGIDVVTVSPSADSTPTPVPTMQPFSVPEVGDAADPEPSVSVGAGITTQALAAACVDYLDASRRVSGIDEQQVQRTTDVDRARSATRPNGTYVVEIAERVSGQGIVDSDSSLICIFSIVSGSTRDEWSTERSRVTEDEWTLYKSGKLPEEISGK